MARLILDVSGLTFFHDSASESVLDSISLRFHEGWTAVVGPNGSGKTTLLRLIAGDLVPAEGSVQRPGDAICCAQRTDDPPEGFANFIDSPERSAHALRGRLDVPDDALDRWETLSHGERKRAQIAAALWRMPSVLLLDEPTNHVDEDGRRLLTSALRSFRGIGLLVSHDRELMEALCGRTLFVENRGAELRTGAYGSARDQREHEAEETRRRLAGERRELKRLDAEAARRKQHAESVERGLSKSKVGRRDSSARSEIDTVRLRGVDKKAMGRAHQLDGRRRQVEDRIASLDAPKEKKRGITLPGERSKRASLLDLPAGSLPMPDGRGLVHPRLRIGTDDRVALTGPNGAGKTTLLTHLLVTLDLPEGRLVHLPQELTREEGAEIATRVRSLPRDRKGSVATIVSRLGSDPERILETASPSPGELRKLMLAFGMAEEPWLITMDEPTNHLDLPSVECLEETLADFPGALLLVSHDRPFLDRLTETEWALRPSREGIELRRS